MKDPVFILTVTSVYDDVTVHCDVYASPEGVKRKIKELVVSKNDEERRSFLKKINIPNQLMYGLLHFGKISKQSDTPDDIKYRQFRLDTYETCLNEAKHFVTTPSQT